jgi:hypothetical protein
MFLKLAFQKIVMQSYFSENIFNKFGENWKKKSHILVLYRPIKKSLKNINSIPNTADFNK